MLPISWQELRERMDKQHAPRARKHPEWDGLTCYYCAKVMGIDDARWIPSEEHPQPKSKGGTEIVPACLLDNLLKQMMTEKQFRKLIWTLGRGDWETGIAMLHGIAEIAVRNRELSKEDLAVLKEMLPDGSDTLNGHGFYWLLTTYSIPTVIKKFRIDETISVWRLRPDGESSPAAGRG